MSKTRFIWTFGVLSWGLPCGLLFAWAMSGTHEKSFWFWLSISLPLWCLGGYGCGYVLWRRMRERHDVEASQQGAASDDRPQAGDRG